MAQDLSKFGFRQVVSLSASIFLRHFGKIAAIGLLCYIPVELVVTLVDPNDPDPMAFVQTTWALRGLFDLFVTIIAMIFVISLTAKEIEGDPTGFSAVAAEIKSSYVPAVLTSIAYSLVLSGLFFFLVVPAIIGMIYTLFFLQIPVLKKETGFHALKRSKRLVEGQFFRIAGYTLLFSGGYQAALFGAEYLATPLSPFLGATVMVGASVITLYFGVAVTVLYLHLEQTRFE